MLCALCCSRRAATLYTSFPFCTVSRESPKKSTLNNVQQEHHRQWGLVTSLPPVLMPVVCAVLTRSFMPHGYILAMTHSLARAWVGHRLNTNNTKYSRGKMLRGQVFLVFAYQKEHVIKHFQVGGVGPINYCYWLQFLRALRCILTTTSCPFSRKTRTVPLSPCFTCGRLGCSLCFGAMDPVVMRQCSFKNRFDKYLYSMV